MDERKHTRLKHYELLDRLGEGGMGVVYRARDTRLGRTVALKVLPEQLARDEDRARRFEREARIATALTHPCIAHLYDIDRDGDTAFLTMELVEGSTLRQLLEQGPVPLRQVLECGVQVAGALEAAHKAGVVHRDLKPENVMAADSGYFKVLDFGVARIEDRSRPGAESSTTRTPTRTWATRAGALVGTVAYMSPEQALGRDVDARSDIFSFGSLLYELATGRPAFDGANEIATAQAVTSREPAPMRTLRPEISKGLEAVVRKCLAKNPEGRYATATELLGDLETLRYDSLAGVDRGRPLRALQGRRRRWAPWAIGAGLLLAAAVLGVGWWRTQLAPRGATLASPDTLAPLDPAAPALPAVSPTGTRPRVIVAFFENNTGDAGADWLSQALPEMMTTDLSRSDRLDVIATQRLYDLMAMSGRGERMQLDRATAPELARWAGADLVISGSVFKLGSRYRMDAQAYDTRTGSVAAAHKVEGEDLFRLVNELTEGLRERLKLGAAPRPTPPQVATSSEEAYRRFLRGQRLYDRLQFRDAAREFREALALDPQFARARLRLAMSLHQAGERSDALPSLDAAVAAADRMPDAERLLALGLHAYFRKGDLEAGGAYLARMLEQFPTEKEAYLWWGTALSELSGDALEATQKLRGAIELDPHYLPAVAAIAEQLADLGAGADAEKLLRDAIQRDPEARASLEHLRERLAKR